MSEMKRCPICGKEPKIMRDLGYEISGLGAWCTIQCKPFMRRPHLKIQQGASTWDRALEYGTEYWNLRVEDFTRQMDLLK